MEAVVLWVWAIGMLIFGLGSAVIGGMIGYRVAVRRFERIAEREAIIAEIEREALANAPTRGFTLKSVQIGRGTTFRNSN